MNRKFIIVLILFTCAATVMGFKHGWWSATPPSLGPAQAAPADNDDPAIGNRPDDQQCADLLKEANDGEALAWLTQDAGNRGVTGWKKPEAIELVKAFYTAGAVKIFVVGAVKVEQTLVASQLVIELPSDAAAREKIFAQDAQFEAQYDDEPTPDDGQKYLQLTTD